MLVQEIYDFDKGEHVKIELYPRAYSSNVHCPVDLREEDVSLSYRTYPAKSSELYRATYSKFIDFNIGSGIATCVYYTIPTKHVYALLKNNATLVDSLPDKEGYKQLCGFTPEIVSDVFNCGMTPIDYQKKFGIILYYDEPTIPEQGNYDAACAPSVLSAKYNKNTLTYNYVVSGMLLSPEVSFSETTNNMSISGICYYSEEYAISFYDRIAIVNNMNATNISNIAGIQANIEGDDIIKTELATVQNINKVIYYSYYGDRPLKYAESTITTLTSPFITLTPDLKLVVLNDKIVQCILTTNTGNGSVNIYEDITYLHSNIESNGATFEYRTGHVYTQREDALLITLDDIDIIYFLKKGVGPWNSLMQIISPLRKKGIEEKFGELTISNDGLLRYGNTFVPVDKFLDVYAGANAQIYEPALQPINKIMVRKIIEQNIIPCGRNLSIVSNHIVQKEELTETSSTTSSIGGGVALQTYTNPIYKEIVEITSDNAIGIKHISLNTVFNSAIDLLTVALNFSDIDNRVASGSFVYEGIYSINFIRGCLGNVKLRKVIYDYIRQTTTVTYNYFI